MNGGTLTEKKRYQLHCNLLLLTSLAIWFGISYVAYNSHPAANSMIHSVWIRWAMGAIPWFWGLAEYAKSKGYSPYWAMLGIFPLLGLLILALMPDRFVLKPEYEHVRVNVHSKDDYVNASRQRW